MPNLNQRLFHLRAIASILVALLTSPRLIGMIEDPNCILAVIARGGYKLVEDAFLIRAVGGPIAGLDRGD